MQKQTSFDFESAVGVPFRMRPGLRRLAADAAQLTPSCHDGRALREKLAVLGSAPGEALLAHPEFDAGAALRALSAHAAREHPDAWQVEGDTVSAPLLGWQLQGSRPAGTRTDAPAAIGACLHALAPGWRPAALLALAFEEDFAIVDAATGRIPWLAVCLPSHWSPAEKVGRLFTEVHAPVADNALLIDAAQHLMRVVTGPERWERFVWTLTPHPHLDAHPARVPQERWPAAACADALAAQTWWRHERQTFIPLPEAAQAVFTIHVEVEPMPAALADPADARRVHDALASMTPAVLDYRGLAPARDRLLDWLARRAAGAV